MANPWLALEVGADARARAGELRRAHEAFLAGSRIAEPVRDVVVDSWRRSAGAMVAPDAMAPVELVDDALEEYRRAHPLAAVMPVLRELLGAVADDGEHVLAVCDAEGRLLWVEGHPGVLRKAEAMNFVPGASWDERRAGTNAPGVATAVDHAVQIFAAEHYSSLVQPWTCAAAPIHDPRTGVLLGAVDITGGDHLASPQSLALVQATARAAEAHLAGLLPQRDGPSGDPSRVEVPFNTRRGRVDHVALLALGRDDALLEAGGRSIRLGRRHSEIVVLLARHPEGLTGDQLSLEMYGERVVNPVTLRAELSRLRHLLGPELLDSRPYRLRAPVDADFIDAEAALDRGNVSSALRAYRGRLLPESNAPGVTRLRDRLESQLRAALLAARNTDLLATWARTTSGDDDLLVWETLLAALPSSSPRHALAAARVGQLRREYGLPAAGHSARATWLQRSHP